MVEIKMIDFFAYLLDNLLVKKDYRFKRLQI